MKSKQHKLNLFQTNQNDQFPSLIPIKPLQIYTPPVEARKYSQTYTQTTSNSSEEQKPTQMSQKQLIQEIFQSPLQFNNILTCSQRNLEIGQRPSSSIIPSSQIQQPILKPQQSISQKKIQTITNNVSTNQQKKNGVNKVGNFKFAWIDPRPSLSNLKIQNQYINQIKFRQNQFRSLERQINQNEPITRRPQNNKLSQQKQYEKYELQIQDSWVIQQFKLANIFHKVIRSPFQLAFRYPYSTHYEYARSKKYTPTIQKVKYIEWIKISQLKILNLNLDMNIPSRGDQEQEQLYQFSGYKRKSKVYYGDKTDEQRALQFVEIIRKAMLNGVDIVLLQQAYQQNIRKLIFKLLNDLAFNDSIKYYYPENLQNFQYSRATLIISKYPVRFGQLQFEIKQHKQQDPKKFYFPLQAFIQFEVQIEGKIERIGILNCHLRSNGQRKSQIPPWRMRQRQLQCIYDWGKRQKYDRYFVIGDTNMPSGQKFKSQNIQADTKFFDAYDQGFSKMGGTYLFRNQRNQVVEQRMDRVLMNKGIQNKTIVKIQFLDILLPGCQNKKMDKKKMLAKYIDELTYISPSDHQMLDITIYFANKK